MRVQIMRWVKALPEQHDVTWPELVSFLTAVKPTSRPKSVENAAGEIVESLPGWVPCEMKDTDGRRVAANVRSVWPLVLDFDKLTNEEWQSARERMQGLSYCWHSTYSFRPESGKLCYRVAVELDRAVPAQQWKPFFKKLADALGGDNDEKCSDPNRFYYGPHCPLEVAPDSGACEGVPISVDDFITQAPLRAVESPTAPGDLTHADLRKLVPSRMRDALNENVRAGIEALGRALNNEPFAVDGERDNTLLYMSGILAKGYPNHTPEQIIAPIRAALDIDDLQPGWAPNALMLKLERDLEKEHQAKLDRNEEVMAQVGRQHGYTDEEVKGFLQRLNLQTVEQLTRQLIITSGSDYWVFNEGDYMFLGGQERAELAIPGRLATCTTAMPVSIGEDTVKGYQEKNIKQLRRQYGTHVAKVVKDLKLQQSYLAGDKFYFAVCRRDPTLRAVQSPAVQAWFERANEPALIDWCASAPRLEKPTAALVLAGAPQTGKTQLAKAVAGIWGERYTPMRDLTASFNDSISRCPVVYADETVPWEFRRDTGLLKDLITADSQQLRQKYVDNATLIGSVRVIIARNDHRLFEAGEPISRGTVQALEDRLLFVDMGTTPAPYFETREIAEHILWLEKTRALAPSRRQGLWVTGRTSRLHYRLRAFTSKVSISVCQWLLSFIDKPLFCGDTAGNLHRLDSQGLQVSPRLVYEKWPMYCGNEHRQPTLAQVAEALEGISSRNGNLCKVDLAVLAEYADSVYHACSTVEALQSAIERAGFEEVRKAN